METTTILSIIALFVSFASLTWQMYDKWIEQKASLQVDYHFAEKVDADEKGKRLPFIEVRVTNTGRKTIFIEKPLICFSTGLTYFKRFEAFPYKEYPIQLTSGEKFKTGIQILTSNDKGEYVLCRGDLLKVKDSMMLIKKDMTFFADHGKSVKNKSTNDLDKKEQITALIKIKDTQGNSFESEDFKWKDFTNAISESRKVVTTIEQDSFTKG